MSLTQAGDGGESLKVVDGQLQIITTSPQTFRAISHFSVYGDADVCVTTVHVKGPEDQSSTGIVYWFADPQNFYWFAISTAGTYAVFRYMKDKWQNIIPWTTSGAVNKGGASQKRTACSHGGKRLHLVRERQADRQDKGSSA